MKQRLSFKDVPNGFYDGMMKNNAYLKNSPLDGKLKELVKFRVSQINGCAFCLDMHHKEAIHEGETEQRLHSLPAWKECPYYSEQERVALEYAEALTLITTNDVDDAMFARLEQVFTVEEIAHLTLIITETNSWNRINHAFRTTPGNYTVGQY
jgi:AhpD family alkylhydroperoxidase